MPRHPLPARAFLRRIVTGIAPGLLALSPLFAATPARAESLTMAIGGSVLTFDPHYYNAAPNSSATAHVFDRLIQRDADSRLRPRLAVSWKPLSDTVWEFRLRPGVKWHDGRDFTADDVAFTLSRVPNVPNSPGGFAGALRGVEKVEVLDPLTLRIHTPGPYPMLPSDMAAFAIVSRHAGEGAATDDYTSGKAAIGTGPYRFVSYHANDRAEFARFGGFWGAGEPTLAQPWEKVSYRFIANDSARTAALLAGDVDVIDQVPASDLPRLKKDPRVAVASVQGNRVMYLSFDRSRRGELPFVTDNNGQPLPRNPFDDVRVRRALSVSINREALAARVMEGTAVATGQWLPEGSYGYEPAIGVPAVDLEAARRLLAEAGYPAGFRLTLHSPNDRYPGDAKTAQSIAQMWTRIGVQTQVEALPWASFAPRSAKQDFAARLAGWGSTSAEPASVLVNILGSYDREKRTGSSNSVRYSNPALDELRDRALAVLDDEKREGMLREAVRMATEDVGMVPLFLLVNSWATRKGIVYEPRRDEGTYAMQVRKAG